MRRFQSGGPASNRPDLLMLARQGIAPRTPPGMPPRVVSEQMFGPSSTISAGGKPSEVIRTDEDPVRWDEVPMQGSVLAEMMNRSANRVQAAHDDAIAAAARQVAHEAYQQGLRAAATQRRRGGPIQEGSEKMRIQGGRRRFQTGGVNPIMQNRLRRAAPAMPAPPVTAAPAQYAPATINGASLSNLPVPAAPAQYAPATINGASLSNLPVPPGVTRTDAAPGIDYQQFLRQVAPWAGQGNPLAASQAARAAQSGALGGGAPMPSLTGAGGAPGLNPAAIQAAAAQRFAGAPGGAAPMPAPMPGGMLAQGNPFAGGMPPVPPGGMPMGGPPGGMPMGGPPGGMPMGGPPGGMPMGGGPPGGMPMGGAPGTMTPIQNPGAAAYGQWLQQQMARAQNAPQLTSANSGWIAPNAPAGFQNPQPTPQQLQSIAADRARILAANPGLAGAGMGFAKGGRVRKFNPTAAAPENLVTHPGAVKKAKGGVLRRKPPKVKLKAKPPVSTPSPYDYEDDGAPAPVPASGPSGAPMMAGAPDGGMGMAKGGKWIQGAIKHPGALHKQLGVPQGKKIPAGKLAKAAKAPGKLGQRARLAETLKGLHKAKGGACVTDKDKDKMAKGGKCDQMAAGGAAKQRKGFPNTTAPPKRLAEGGKVRGCGIATKGCRFSGVY
jgi:hypothetical protein